MVVYGWRELSDGTNEVLVHTGWANDIIADGTTYRMKEVWVSADIATFLYEFTYSLTNNWHLSRNTWKKSSQVSITATFSVDRLGGRNRFETSQLVAKYGRDQSDEAVVMSGENSAFPDACAASGLAGVKDAPIITTSSTTLSPEASAALRYLGVKRVYIIGGTPSVSDAVKNEINALPNVVNVQRICGATRYATAEAVYDYAEASWGNPNGFHFATYQPGHTWKNGRLKKAAIIVTGESFADGMAASSLSAYAHYPIFLVQADGTLTEATKSRLRQGNFDEIYCVGGGAYAAAREASNIIDPADLTTNPPGYNWFHHAFGNDRYSTAHTVAFFARMEGMSERNVTICTGYSPVDAYSGGALKNPILFADSYNTSYAEDYLRVYYYNVHGITILGSSASISDEVLARLNDSWVSSVYRSYGN